MLLMTKGRYAVMAMVDIALNSNSSPVLLASIAERQGIDHGYLEQIFIKLKKSGLVTSVRGPGGGYKLAKTSKTIKISEIMEAVDESMKMTRCTSDKKIGCLKAGVHCATHHLWDQMGKHLNAFLNAISLDDVCKHNILIFKEVSYASS
jgi:Rrf2 family iron-sulfur cluster assembly transcriptional regulator